MADQAIYSPMRVLDENGDPVPGALVTFYAAGTLTMIDVWSDVDGTILATNPVAADADGNLPQRFVAEAAKVVITDAQGATLRTIDPIPLAPTSFGSAASIGFAPTANIPASNVQGAVEMVDSNARLREAVIDQRIDDLGDLAEMDRADLVLSQSDWNAGTETDECLISPAKRKIATRADMSAGGDAPMFACRAWVNFNGVTGAIRASGNIASVTKNGTGDYTLNFTTAMEDANYAVLMSSKGENNTTIGSNNNPRPTAYAEATTTTVRIFTASLSATMVDAENVSVAIFR